MCVNHRGGGQTCVLIIEEVGDTGVSIVED